MSCVRTNKIMLVIKHTLGRFLLCSSMTRGALLPSSGSLLKVPPANLKHYGQM